MKPSKGDWGKKKYQKLVLTFAEQVCRSKRRYGSRGQAEKGAWHSIAQGRVARLLVYQCKECGGWHLTHKEGRDSFPIRPKT